MNLNLFPKRDLDQSQASEKENPGSETIKMPKSPGNEDSAAVRAEEESPIPSKSAQNTHRGAPNQDSPEKQNASKSAQKENNANAFQQKQIPLETLIRERQILIFDLSALTHTGFPRFIQTNAMQIQAADAFLHVPYFTVSSIQGKTRENIQQLLKSEMFSSIGDSTDTGYDDLFAHLSKMKPARNQVCFVVNLGSNRRKIIDAAKANGMYVQLFTIDDSGNLNSRIKSNSGDDSAQHKSEQKTGEKQDRKSPGLDPNRFALCSKPEKINILPVQSVKKYKSGDTVYDSNGRAIRLVSQQYVNSNALTYKTDADGMFAKIYNPSSLSNNFLEEKAKRMLTKKVSCKGLCWPTDILRDSKGRFVGILVPPATGEPLHLAIFKEANLQKSFPDWDKKDLCDLTISILNVIQYLHSMNILMGCINPASIRIAGKDEVYFMDTDDYQVEGFPTLFHNTTFTPPELLGKKLYLCSKENENYAIAVLTFMMMMPGKAPYNKEQNQTWKDAITAGDFPFSYGSVHKGRSEPSTWRFMWSHLTPFKGPFYNTFQKDGKFTKPENRRTVADWINTVQTFREDLEDPYDPESLKIFPRTFKRSKNETFYKCSICGVEHPRFYFKNKYFDEFQICNECIDKQSDVSFTCQSCHKTYIYTYETKLYHQMMKKIDSDWRDQRHCRDCKKKTIQCVDCGEEKPYYLMTNGRCRDCYERYRNKVYQRRTCKDCGRQFNITNGEHEFALQKGINDPVRCKSCRDRKKRFGSF